MKLSTIPARKNQTSQIVLKKGVGYVIDYSRKELKSSVR